MTALEKLLVGGDEVHGNVQRLIDDARQEGAVQRIGPHVWSIGYDATVRFLKSDGLSGESHYVNFFGGAVGSLLNLQENWLETSRGATHARRRQVTRRPFSATGVMSYLLREADAILDEELARLGDSFEGDLNEAFSRPVAQRLIRAWTGLPPLLQDEFLAAVRGVGRTVGRPLANDHPDVLRATERLDHVIPALRDLLNAPSLPPGLLSSLKEHNSGPDEHRLTDLELVASLINFAFDSELLEPQLSLAVAEMLTEASEAAHHLTGKQADQYVWEVLRLGTASPLLLRRASSEIAEDGVTVAPGEWVVVYTAAALRDPVRFANPAQVDMGRGPTSLVFGAGANTCLGGRLAFHVVKSVLHRLLTEYQVKLAGPVTWMAGPYRGIERLPLKLIPRS
jgi:cytochrome P450